MRQQKYGFVNQRGFYQQIKPECVVLMMYDGFLDGVKISQVTGTRKR